MSSYSMGDCKNAFVVNQMKLKFPSLSVNESAARSAIAAFCVQADPDALELADIKCAVSEAVTNCIVHAYPDKIGSISVVVDILEERRIRIQICDTGKGIPDVRTAREPLYTTDTTGERSGMGFTVMENFCDGVRVSSKMGKGTKVLLYKSLRNRRVNT